MFSWRRDPHALLARGGQGTPEVLRTSHSMQLRVPLAPTPFKAAIIGAQGAEEGLRAAVIDAMEKVASAASASSTYG